MVNLTGSISLSSFYNCLKNGGIPLYIDDNIKEVTNQEAFNTFPIDCICIYWRNSSRNFFVKVKVVGHIPINEWFDHPQIIIKEVNDDNEYDPQSCTFFNGNEYPDNVHVCGVFQLLPFEFLNAVSI